MPLPDNNSPRDGLIVPSFNGMNDMLAGTSLRRGLLLLTGWTMCAGLAVAEDWPEWMGAQRDGEWRETGLVKTFPAGGPPVRWRIPVGGGYSGPSVVGTYVYLTDKQLPAGQKNPDDPFARDRQQATERVLCFNDADGSLVWKHEYDCPYTVSYPAGPRTTPLVRDGRVYTLGAEGHLLCLDAETGKVVWAKHFATDLGTKTPVWGFSSNPLLDGDKLIVFVGGKDSTAVAFHKDTGEVLWRSLDSLTEHGPGYSSPIIIEAGGKRQLIVWHPAGLSGLDPESGKVYWTQPMVLNYGMACATPRVEGDQLFVSAFYNGSMLLNLNRTEPTTTVAWRRQGQSEKNTDALHCVFSTPVIDHGSIYGVDSYGELRCLDLKTGDRQWATFEATSGKSARWGSAFLTKTGDRYVLFSEQGDLILADLTPKGYHEISRAHLLEPTGPAQRRDVVWVHPAFAHKNVYVRNDKELVSVSLKAE